MRVVQINQKFVFLHIVWLSQESFGSSFCEDPVISQKEMCILMRQTLYRQESQLDIETANISGYVVKPSGFTNQGFSNAYKVKICKLHTFLFQFCLKSRVFFHETTDLRKIRALKLLKQPLSQLIIFNIQDQVLSCCFLRFVLNFENIVCIVSQESHKSEPEFSLKKLFRI